jgi:hypothetical protein
MCKIAHLEQLGTYHPVSIVFCPANDSSVFPNRQYFLLATLPDCLLQLFRTVSRKNYSYDQKELHFGWRDPTKAEEHTFVFGFVIPDGS